MSQIQIKKLYPKFKFNLHERRKLSSPEGPKGRHDKIRKIVTALFKYERIETNYNKGDESRGYAEQLISDAIKYGDCHKPTMEMASYWIIEKQLIHKLFKVLVPRYQNCPLSYTKMWRAPNVYPGYGYKKCVLELRNNIYPPLGPDKSYNKNLIHNVLLRAANLAFEKEKKSNEKVNNDNLKKETQELGNLTNFEALKLSEADIEKLDREIDESLKESDESIKPEAVKLSEDLSQQKDNVTEKNVNFDQPETQKTEENESKKSS